MGRTITHRMPYPTTKNKRIESIEKLMSKHGLRYAGPLGQNRGQAVDSNEVMFEMLDHGIIGDEVVMEFRERVA